MKQQSQSIDTAFAVARRLASRACLASGRNDGPLLDLRIRVHVPVHQNVWKKVSRGDSWLGEDPELALPFPFLAQDAQHYDLGMSSSEPFDNMPCPCNFPFWPTGIHMALVRPPSPRRHLIRGSSANPRKLCTAFLLLYGNMSSKGWS